MNFLVIFKYLRCRKYVTFIFYFSAVLFVIIVIFLLKWLNIIESNVIDVAVVSATVTVYRQSIATVPARPINIEERLNVSNSPPNYNLHIFYYAWYGNTSINKRWIHWNHKRLRHWNDAIADKFSQEDHSPPEDIGSDFYPYLGLYSSFDSKLRRIHFRMIRYAGVGVIVLSWYPKAMADPNGIPVDDLVKIILDEASEFQLKVALHLEPYPNRSIFTIKNDILYITTNYGRHPAFFRKQRFGSSNVSLPVLFIYDSYRINDNHWYKLLGKGQPVTIRGKPEDSFVVGLFFERDSCTYSSAANFDALYSYFAAEYTSYGSNGDHWKKIHLECSRKHLDFYPSIGPGYKDESVRPWNSQATRSRDNGKFFVERFSKLREANVSSFGITSFNEWHEGTQIEPSIPFNTVSDRLPYESYLPNSPFFYLDLTKEIAESFRLKKDVNLE